MTIQMKRRLYPGFALSLVLFIVGAAYITTGYAYGQSQDQSVTATVNVACAFSVQLSALTDNNTASGSGQGNMMYVLPLTSNVPISYSVSHPGGCSIAAISGSLNVAYSNGTRVYSTTLSNTTGTVHVPYGSFKNESELYTAKMTFDYQNFTNSSSSNFRVVEPAILMITNLAAGSGSVTQGSSLTVSQYVNNTGFLAPTNMVLHTVIDGPGSFNEIVNSSLSSTGFYSFSVRNATGSPGRYNVSDRVYYFNGVANAVSSAVNTSYTVYHSSGQPSSNHTSLPSPPTQISNLELTSVSILDGSSPGGSSLSNIGLKNTGNAPMWVNVSVPDNLDFGRVSASANAVYLLPNQSLNLQLSSSTDANASTGSHVIPITINIAQQGHVPITETVYHVIDITNVSLAPGIESKSIVVQDSGTQAVGLLDAYNPLNMTIYNATAYITLPIGVSSNAENIKLSGFAYNVTTLNDSYVLSWVIPQIPAGQSVSVYYTIDNVTNPTLMVNPATSFSIPAATTSSVTIFNVNIPALYVNGTETVTVSSIYTGQKATNITFSLTGPQNLRICNSTQTFSVTANSQMYPKFCVSAGPNAGTYVLYLYIYGSGVNQTYTFPVTVFPNAVPTSTAAPVGASGLSKFMGDNLYTLMVVIIALTAVITLARAARKPRYKRERAHRLMNMKKQIERGDDS